MLVKLVGVHKVRVKLASGQTTTYYYAWRGGPRMKEKPGTTAFANEWLRHKHASAPKSTKTVGDLIDAFTGPEDARSVAFLALAEKTREDYLYDLKVIRKEFGTLPVKLTQQRGMKADIRKWHHSFAANPRKADKLLFALSKVFSNAIAEELIEKNPCTGIERLYAGSRREHVWTPDLVSKFRALAQPHILLAFEMAIYTGQRQGDLLALPWKAYDGIHLTFQQSKTGKRVKIRVHAKLKALLDKLPRDTIRILTNSRGRPWTKDGFKTSWGKECKRLAELGVGLQGLTFHDLRGTFITERRREGSTVEQISAITGHSISEVRNVLEKHYLADDQQTSDAVILRMERTQDE